MLGCEQNTAQVFLSSTALVELVGSAMRGFDLGAGADTGLKPEFHGGAQRKGLEQRIRNAFAAAPGGNGPLRAVLFSLTIFA